MPEAFRRHDYVYAVVGAVPVFIFMAARHRRRKRFGISMPAFMVKSPQVQSGKYEVVAAPPDEIAFRAFDLAMAGVLLTMTRHYWMAGVSAVALLISVSLALHALVRGLPGRAYAITGLVIALLMGGLLALGFAGGILGKA